jgi:hypothetical protein
MAFLVASSCGMAKCTEGFREAAAVGATSAAVGGAGTGVGSKLAIGCTIEIGIDGMVVVEEEVVEVIVAGAGSIMSADFGNRLGDGGEAIEVGNGLAGIEANGARIISSSPPASAAPPEAGVGDGGSSEESFRSITFIRSSTGAVVVVAGAAGLADGTF